MITKVIELDECQLELIHSGLMALMKDACEAQKLLNGNCISAYNDINRYIKRIQELNTYINS